MFMEEKSTKIKSKYAENLSYESMTYKYSHSKGNVLVYIRQPQYYYEDWTEDGGILIVKYRENVKNGKYYVLHCIDVSQFGNGYMTHINLTGKNRIAKECI